MCLFFSFHAGVRGLEVEQSPSALSLQEGAGAALKCNFSSSVTSVQWFRQNLRGGGLTSLFFIASGMKQSGRLNCTLNTRERSNTLHIADSQLEDSLLPVRCGDTVLPADPGPAGHLQLRLCPGPSLGHLHPQQLWHLFRFSDLCYSTFSLQNETHQDSHFTCFSCPFSSQ